MGPSTARVGEVMWKGEVIIEWVACVNCARTQRLPVVSGPADGSLKSPPCMLPTPSCHGPSSNTNSSRSLEQLDNARKRVGRGGGGGGLGVQGKILPFLPAALKSSRTFEA